MIIIGCQYKNLDDGRTLIFVQYNINYKEVLRCVKTKYLIIKPSAFINLKREEAILLDTSKVNKIQIKNQLDLF